MARLKGRNRRLGWEPPVQINVKVTHGTYKYIQGVAADKQQRNCPFYSTLESIIREYHQLKQDSEQNDAFLALAIDDKKSLTERE